MHSKDHIWRELINAAQAGEKESYKKLLKDMSEESKSLLEKEARFTSIQREEINQTIIQSIHKQLGTYHPESSAYEWFTEIVNYRIDRSEKRNALKSITALLSAQTHSQKQAFSARKAA